MRLTSTGLGIGTSSPSSKLHVATTTSETGVQLTNNNATVYLGAVYSANNFANGTVAGQAILRSGVGIAFSTTSGASVQATLDGSGNLGLGVTPSAWSSSFGIKAFDISGGAVYGSSSDVNMVWNGVYNTSNQWKYKTSATANLYTQDGAHKWFTAPSGTAGNAITFTQAMTLGSNGFLGIGQTSPAYPIDISTGANSAQIAFQSTISNGTNFKIAQGIQGVTNSGMQIYDLTNSAVRLAIDGSGNLLVGTTSTSNKVEIQQTATNAALWVQTGGTTSSYTIADFRTGTNASALAIYGDRTSIFNGNVGLDITPSAWISPTFQSQYAGFHGHYYGASNNQTLVTSNAYVSSDTNFRYMYSGPSLCLTSNNGAGWFWNYAGSGTGGNVISYTTLMTLNTSGTLLLGTTQGNPYSGFEIAPNSGASFQIIGHASGTGSGSAYMNFNYNQSGCGSITQNGTSAVLYNITSDYRLKEVIGSVTGSGERIDALQPIDYLMKADGSQHRGFLAHKFQEVYPNSVVGEKDAIDAQENPVYQQMQASTAEVIADLVAEIQSLRKRLADAGI
jgi:hypothetical protein